MHACAIECCIRMFDSCNLYRWEKVLDMKKEQIEKKKIVNTAKIANYFSKSDFYPRFYQI